MRKKVAIILSRFPYPLDKGDKLRAYHQLKYLSLHADIFLYSLHTADIKEEHYSIVQQFCKEINLYKITSLDIFKGFTFSLLNKYPVQVGYFFSKEIKRKITESIESKNIDTVYCQLSRTALYGKDLKCKKVLDFQDAFSVNYKRLSENAGGIYKAFYKREYKTMQAYEQKMLEWFDTCTIISEYDKSQIKDAGNKITVIPNGVDTAYFSSSGAEKKYDIAFVGNLSYLPNKNAVHFFAEQIFPILVKQFPAIKINIAGADTPQDIYAFANENITVSGFVTDIRDVYNDAKIFVAPLFTGAGLQNKILEAMSMEVPCITTSVVNASLNAEEDKQIFIANDEQEFVSKIAVLLSSEQLRNGISKNARSFVEENYSWKKANGKLEGLL